MKKDCRFFKREQSRNREKEKSKKGNYGSKGKAKIEKINVVESSMDTHVHESTLIDILVFTSEIASEALLAQDDMYVQNWIIDSGASFHVTPHREWFSSYAVTHGTIKLGDSYKLDIQGIGDVKLAMSNGMEFVLHNVRHVPLRSLKA